MKLENKVNEILNERFGKDSLIALATSEDDIPYVRFVNAYYENGLFYIITYALSNKIKQIEKNPIVSVAGEWFSGTGKALNLGYFGREQNKVIASKLKTVFSSWINNGHNNYNDENTIILCIQLSNGIVFYNGMKYEF
ncbi:MAG: pyridoxamine 5'-phosphate oxidase family protein [Anaeroplasma sp.]